MRPASTNRRRTTALLAVVLLAAPQYCHAADQLRVGYAAQLLAFAGPLYAAEDQGLFRAHGLEVERIEFAGGAKLHQGIVAGAVDIGLAGGTDFSYVLKGAPELVVANIASPTNTVLTVTDPAIRTIDDLKGKHIGVTSIGTYTYWLALELARKRGWGPNGVTPVAIGGSVSVWLSALQTGQVAATMGDATVGFAMQQNGQGRVLTTAADFAPDVPANLMFAHTELLTQRPDVMRRFLQAWLEGITWLIDHKPEAVAIGQRITGQNPKVMAAVFDLQKDGWSRDGKITPPQLSATAQALLASGMVNTLPDLTPAYTDAYLPR